MKKMITLMLALTCLLTVMTGFAHAEDASWYCGVCGTERTTEWCPDCGTHRPADSTGSWPVKEMNGIGTSLRSFNDQSKRHQSYFGPNRNYPGAGAYKPYKVTGATALFREGDYVLVDLSYQTVGRRCLYFKASALTNASVENAVLSDYPATIVGSVQPKFGPGYEYDDVVKTNQNGTTTNVVLSNGTRISVFFEMNGWVYAEFGSILGTIRGWLPADMVQ